MPSKEPEFASASLGPAIRLEELHENRDRTAGLTAAAGRTIQNRFEFRVQPPRAYQKYGTLERDQRTLSVIMENKGRLFNRPSVLEGELAWFSGDHDGTNGPASGLDRRDTAVYGQLSGGSSKFTYRLRMESNGQDFRPAGANVSPDRKTAEGFFTWNLQSGRSAQFRLQRFKDGWETANCRTTRVAGLGLQGPVDQYSGVFGAIDMFIEEHIDSARTLDTHVRSTNADLSKTFSDRLSGRLGFSYRFLDDNVRDAGDGRLNQLSLGFDHSVRIADLPGRLGVTMENRLLDNGGERSHEWTPALNLNVHKGPHDFGIHYRLFSQDQVNPLLLDVDTSDLGLRYRYHRGADTFGVEYLRNHRDTTGGLWTRSTQITAFYQRDIDAILRTGRHLKTIPAPSATTSVSEDPVIAMLTAGRPGSSYEEALRAFARPVASDLVTAEPETSVSLQRWGGFDFIERRVFEEVSSRQRLIVVRSGDTVEKTVLAIDTGKTPSFVQDVFERIKRDLIQRLGAPKNFHEKGTFGPTLERDLRDGSFLRVYDWSVGEGTLRLGIPRRMDNTIRIEVQFGASFSSIPEIPWGLDSFY